MRPLLLLAVCSLLTIPLACTEKKVIVRASDPTPSAESGDEDVDDPEPEPEPKPEPKPAPTDPLLVDLGDVQVGTDVTFDIPEGALGFNITAEGKLSDFNPNAPFGIERIVDPNGDVVHDAFTPKGGTSRTSVASLDAIAAASVPQGEGAPKSLAGKWTVRFGVVGSSTKKPTLKGTVRVQSSGDGQFYGGTLELHVHVPEGIRIDNKVVDPSKAESTASLTGRIDRFFEVTSSLLGFERGEVVYHPEPKSLSELDGIEQLLRGFSVSNGMKDGTQAFHVLLTNTISNQGQPFAAGISPGIPGAATVFGRNVSGIIVTPYASLDQDVLTMVHEMGHFFGLNHTSEFDGRAFDPLSDTPKCTTISNQDLYRCPDRTNIMFPAGAIDGPVSLSPTQQRVYRGSPIYKAVTKGAAKTMAFAPPASPIALRAQIRASGSMRLSSVERELAAGFCGLTPLDADGIVQRNGRAEAIRQLETAAADADLAPYIRGRATLALRALGVQ